MTVYQLVRHFQWLKTRAVTYANGCAFHNPPKGSPQDSNEAWANRWLAAYRHYGAKSASRAPGSSGGL